MKLFVRFLIIVIFGAGLIWLFLLMTGTPKALSSMEQRVISADSGTFAVVVAKTGEEQEKGLGGIDSIPANFGMLFSFDHNAKWGIWMKDMHFPIDIIWIRGDGTIDTIKENIEPSTYPSVFTPVGYVPYVLELPASSARKYGLSVGEKFSLGQK